MSLHTRVSGAWKTVNTVYVKVSGAWKTCRQVYVRQNGVWKKCLQNTSTTTINGPGLGLGNGVTINNITTGTTVKLTGTFTAPNNSGQQVTLHVVYTGCSKTADFKSCNSQQTADFSFSVTANSSSIYIEIGSVLDGMHWTTQGTLSNFKIQYTTTGYFD